MSQSQIALLSKGKCPLVPETSVLMQLILLPNNSSILEIKIQLLLLPKYIKLKFESRHHKIPKLFISD